MTTVQTYDGFAGFMEFFRARAKALAMEVVECDLGALYPDWRTGWDAVRRLDGAYFLIRGAQILRAAGREFARWFQPLIFGEKDGAVLLVATDDGYVLVRAKGEPGNPGYVVDGTNTRVLVSATVQGSKDTIDGTAGGKPVPLACLLRDTRFRVSHRNVAGDGARFWEKWVRYSLVWVPNREAIEAELAELGDAQADFAWVTLDVLRAMRDADLANAHLCELGFSLF